MPPRPQPVDTFTRLPDPGEAKTLDDLIERLRLLKVWAGDPSYETITGRVNTAWAAAGRPARELAGKTTVVDCFRRGRRRMNTDLVLAVVQALHPDAAYTAHWRRALRVIGGRSQAASQVSVQGSLPPEPAGFTGRTSELGRLRQAGRDGREAGGPVAVCAIHGMAGVGKTQLAVQAGHLLAREKPFDHVLFVNLRGFHPDPASPPADPAAVLDGFLRLLGVPGHQMPRGLKARAAAYRDRVAGTRTLTILDNAADVEQVRPLVARAPGCVTVVTSRHTLGGLNPAVSLTLGVFTAGDAMRFLADTAGDIPTGPDPDALARIARLCGYLPLALSLVAAHVLGTPGWTLTDHADRLDERYRDRRLDTGVELALDLSYQHLSLGHRRLLRFAALHPGQDLDVYAAAALTGVDLPTAEADLAHLRRVHLLQQPAPGRYSFHDLVRAYATGRAGDEDPPRQRRGGLTRLFDHYLAASAAAVDTLHPAEAHHRPRIAPPGTPTPALDHPAAARAWLDRERPNLVAVAAHTANHGWGAHTIRLSSILFRYLSGGYSTEALLVHGHARDAACRTGDPAGQAHALTNLGVSHLLLGRFRPAVDALRQALHLFQRVGDRVGEGRAWSNLGMVDERLDRLAAAADHYERALVVFRQVGDRTREACTLGNLGDVEVMLGRYGRAADHFRQAWDLHHRSGDLLGEAWMQNSLGVLHTRTDQPVRAADHHRQALAIFRAAGERDCEARVLNGLGEAALAAGGAADALMHHSAAHALAGDIGAVDERARAHVGLGHTHRALGDPARARHHYQRALTLYTDLGMPQATDVRANLSALDATDPG